MRVAVVLAAAWLFSGCTSFEPPAGWPKPVREVVVEHGPLAAVGQHSGSVRVGEFTDARGIADKTRIGELHAPGVVTPVTGEGAPVFATLQLLALANPLPTGKFITLKDARGLDDVLARAMRDALLQAGYAVDAAAAELQGTIIEFWLRPSWTVVCEVRVELRLVDDGNVRWRKQLHAQHEKFIGLWTEDEFAGVIRAAMDSLLNRAAAEFANEEFAALATGR